MLYASWTLGVVLYLLLGMFLLRLWWRLEGSPDKFGTDIGFVLLYPLYFLFTLGLIVLAALAHFHEPTGNIIEWCVWRCEDGFSWLYYQYDLAIWKCFVRQPLEVPIEAEFDVTQEEGSKKAEILAMVFTAEAEAQFHALTIEQQHELDATVFAAIRQSEFTQVGFLLSDQTHVGRTVHIAQGNPLWKVFFFFGNEVGLQDRPSFTIVDIVRTVPVVSTGPEGAIGG